MPHQVCLASLSRRSCDKYAFQKLLHKLVKFSCGNEASFLSRSALVSCFISCIQKHRVSCKGLWLLNIMKQARDSHFRISTQVGTSERWPSQDDLEVVALAGSVSSAFCVWTSAVHLWYDLGTEIAKCLRRPWLQADKAVPEAPAVVALSMQIWSMPRHRSHRPEPFPEESTQIPSSGNKPNHNSKATGSCFQNICIPKGCCRIRKPQNFLTAQSPIAMNGLQSQESLALPHGV